MLGIGFHSLIDGAIYSVAFSVSIFTGYLATIGMVLHEFPEGIVTYLLLLARRPDRGRARLLAFIAAAATTPLGMLASWPLVSTIDDRTLGALLALSAGALIYVGATHLLPRAEQEGARFSLVALAGGVLVAVLVAHDGHRGRTYSGHSLRAPRPDGHPSKESHPWAKAKAPPRTGSSRPCPTPARCSKGPRTFSTAPS
ncbi:MAG: ZIP family metal transporter [Gammaproteobacteria bacterium]|nr:ZIP family metal transporter [Gammaproteobacteria bacterium]